MFGSGFKLESALVEITYTFHYHLDEWSSVFDALRHDDGRVDVVALLMGDDALLGSFHITGCHACLKVDGGCRYRAVDGYLGMGSMSPSKSSPLIRRILILLMMCLKLRLIGELDAWMSLLVAKSRSLAS